MTAERWATLPVLSMLTLSVGLFIGGSFCKFFLESATTFCTDNASHTLSDIVVHRFSHGADRNTLSYLWLSKA